MDYLEIGFWEINFKIKSYHYLTRYLNFISSKIDRDIELYEKHHIVPRCTNLKINDIVKLSPREHFIAHYILSKCFEGNISYKLNHAFSMMVLTSNTRTNYIDRNYKISSRLYEKASELNREDFKRNVINNKEVRNKITATMIRQYKNGERKTRRGKSSFNKGMISLYNDERTIYIYKEELKQFMENNPDYQLGTRYNIDEDKLKIRNENLKLAWAKNKENRTGKNHPRYGSKSKYMNNGVDNKMIPLDKVDEYLSMGWVFGNLHHRTKKIS